MEKLGVSSIDYVLDALKILADNPYSFLWDITEDFIFNGHKISVKDSTQYMSVIIDGVYQQIGGKTPITVLKTGKTYKNRLDYIRDLLLDKVYDSDVKESIDFGAGTKKDIRLAIENAVKVNEDDAIKIFNSGSKEYTNLEAAAKLLTLFTGNKYHVGETFFDYGQDWKWTTLLKDSDYGSVQALTPAEQKMILSANTAQELGKAVDAVINRKPYV